MHKQNKQRLYLGREGNSKVRTILWISNEVLRKDELAQIEADGALRVVFAADLAAAVEILRNEPIAAVLLQAPVDRCSAEELLADFSEARRHAPVVIHEPNGLATRGATLSLLGAFQYISHPVPYEELRGVLALAIQRGAKPESASIQPEHWRKLLVGASDSMREVLEVIRLVGNRRSTVLITGATGTGKDLAAKALHMASSRSPMKMVAVNCAALPENLLEAELFGHTRGAFTGAVNARVGLFEQAHRGTIFLDEIGEMPLQLQSKLLRVLQEREIQRIGSSETIPVDVRVIAASNVNVAAAVAQRRFREDLYYRLNVVSLRMPPLRERVTDIPELAQHFLRKIAEQESAQPKHISPAALEKLMRYQWPGNVRQLEHAVEAAVALSGSRSALQSSDFELLFDIPPAEFEGLASLEVPESGINFDEVMTRIERRLLEQALLKSGGNKARAASLLHMKRTTLISKFKALEVCA